MAIPLIGGLNTTGLTSGIFSLLGSFFVWIIILIIILVLSFGILIIRKRRKLKFPVYIMTNLGKGKMGIDTKSKAGWFKTRVAFFGLLDYGGEEVLKTKDNRIIIDASSEDFQEINGKRGIVCIRSSQDPKILVPVTKMRVENKELLNAIAPATFRETAVSIIKQTERETSDKWQKIAPWLAIGGMTIILLISIIVIAQLIKSSQAKSAEVLLQAGQITKENIETICRGFVSNTLPSGAP